MLSESQQEALEVVTSQPGLAVLCGGPGTGKTFTVAQLLKQLALRGGEQVGVAAPTGKAALRLCEQFAEQGVSERAVTIHSLLGVEGVDDGGFRFRHDRHNPLPYSVIVVDEFSMVSTPLASTFLSAVAPGTKVICVGDINQLSPVEHGAPLRDLISSGVAPAYELTEIRRNSGRIVEACHSIRTTGKFSPSVQLNLADGENLKHIDKCEPESVLAFAQALIEHCPKDFDPLRDVQFIVSLNDKGDLCREKLNLFLRSVLNPDAPEIRGCSIRLNDKVICRKNCGLKEIDEDGRELGKAWVANGEMGVVTCSHGDEIGIRLDTGTYVSVGGSSRAIFDPAYAITVHKSQGSQWPVVVYISDEYGGARRVSCRELIYTAISRAQKLAFTVGSFSTITQDLRRVALRDRKTFLKELLLRKFEHG